MKERNNIVIIGDLSKVRVTRITTRAKRSWKWQDRFGLSTYQPRRTKSGEVVWHCIGKNPTSSDFSINHAPNGFEFGGLHNLPLGYAKQSEIRMI